MTSETTTLSPDESAKCPKCPRWGRTGSLANDALPPHGCPFQQEIHDSTDDDYCDCCADCRQECADDI